MDSYHRNLGSLSNREKTIETEIYYLICKFLSLGPCTRAAQAIREEIEENQLLPLAYSWTGEQRRTTLSQFERNYRHIRNDHLIQICSRIGPILDTNIPPSVPGINSLLGAGSTSLLRTSSVIKSSNSSHALFRRLHEAPILPSSNKAASNPGNIVNILLSRESSGPLSVNRSFSTSMYSKQQMHKRYLGHLSSVYCVAFDRTGKYIFTGADDHLVKIWSAISGRLLATLRGHSSEITDLAVNFENTLLASGSCDKIIRVWSLRTTEPITILVGHTATITSLKFCPYSATVNRFLISTSNDGSVNIWRWNASTNIFDAKPIKFVEKRHKANAQILCSSFSPGGSFLAVGSTDHFVRVYHLSPPTGPVRLLELNVNTDQVDSIQFSNFGLKFISGSKDGTAHIWWFERQTWQRHLLNMNEVLPPAQPNPENDGKANKIKVNMVCWTCDDVYVITAVNDRSIKVWEANSGKLKHVLREHEDEVFVLEANPVDGRIFLSGGHDGKIIIWDVILGEPITVFCNQIEGQGAGAIFDCKFSPDGQMIASTDSHGHLAIYGYGTKDRYERVPTDVFFHTDYRPLIRDANHYVIDEQTQCAPHLMPPPFLVDIDGNPYPPNLQRLVPGRENCKDDQLVPYIAIQNDRGVAEVLQPVVGGQEIPPQILNRQYPFVNNHHDRIQPTPPPQQPPVPPVPPPRPPSEPSPPQHQSRPTIDDMIERLAQEQARERVNVEHGYAASSVSGDEQGAQRARSLSQSVHPGPSSSRNGPRPQEGQGVRQPGASWQSRDKMSTTPLGGRVVVETLRRGILDRMMRTFEIASNYENKIYEDECRRRKIQDIPKPEPTKPKEVVKAKQKKRVVRRDARTNADNAESSALSQNRGGSSISNDLENVEDYVSMEDDDSNYSDSDMNSWSGSSSGDSDSEGDDDDDDDDDDDEESDDDDERSSEIVTRSAKSRSSRRSRNPDSWKGLCRDLIEAMIAEPDAEPFRWPICEVDYPDYRNYVDRPIDLTTIREELATGNYRTLHDFTKDVELIFENSRNYNTDSRSQIYKMTFRLRRWFRERMKFIGSRGNRRSHRTVKKNKKKDGGYKLRNKSQRKENLRYEDFVTTTINTRKKTKLKRKNEESAKKHLRASRETTASSCSSRSPSTFDPSQPSTSGLSSRVTSQNEGKRTRRTRRRVIRNVSDDEDENGINDAPGSSGSCFNGISNGTKNPEYFKSLVESSEDDEETDIEDSATIAVQANGFNNHSGSDTEIEGDKDDTDATEIAGDDETQDGVGDVDDDGPGSSRISLPKSVKRRKVRKSNTNARKRPKMNGTINGGDKVRLKKISEDSDVPVNHQVEVEPAANDEPIDEQRIKTEPNAKDDDICPACNQRHAPNPENLVLQEADEWVACDSCMKWYHQKCVIFPEGFDVVADSYCCDPCKVNYKPTERKRRRPSYR